jgi:ribosomal protein S18 acetylase RimI-like enzyme
MERSSVILHVCELHIETDSEKKGLGRFLMQAAELVALKRKMEVVILTVFKANVPARLFD